MRWRLRRAPSASSSAALLARAVSVLLALLVTGLVLAAAGDNPFSLGARVLTSTLGSRFGWEDIGTEMVPLLLTGLAVAVMARIGLWNVGAEGQFYAGAVASTGISLATGGPGWLMLPALLLAGSLGGAAWMLIPAVARAYGDVSEIVTTLMLNFVAVLLVGYLATGPWLDRAHHAIASTARIEAKLPALWGSVHAGLPLAIVMALVAAGLLAFTVWGFEVRISGANPHAARYAGIPLRSRTVAVMLLSGALAGLAGAVELVGTTHHLQSGISNNAGYLGLVLAVLARGSLLGVIASATLISILFDAGIVLQPQGITINTVLAVTGLILILTAIGEEVAHYRLVPVPARIS